MRYDVGVVVFTLPGGVPLYAYSLSLSLGVACGLVWVAWRAPHDRVLTWVDGGLWALLGALPGARLGFVLFHWNYFQLHPLEVFAISRGGLAWAGALIGGVVALAVYARRKRIAAALLADGLSPLLISLATGALLGCWLQGCAYAPAAETWWGLPSRDEWGLVESRLPLQLLGALALLIWYWLVERAGRLKPAPPGSQFALTLIGLSLVLLALSFLRADALPIWLGLHLDGWISIGLFFISLIFLLFNGGSRRYSTKRG